MFTIGDRIKITSVLNKNTRVNIGAIGYIIRAFFQPTMRCLLLEIMFVAKKPERKFIVVDVGLAKHLRHKLINNENIFQVVKGLYNKGKLLKLEDRLATSTLGSLLIDLFIPFTPITTRYWKIAVSDKIRMQLVRFRKEPISIFDYPHEEYIAWLKSVFIGFSDIFSYLLNDNLNRELYVKFLNKLFRNLRSKLPDIEVVWDLIEDGEVQLKLRERYSKYNIATRSQVCLTIQELKAKVYPIVLKMVMDRFNNIMTNINATTFNTILYKLNALRRYTLNYGRHNEEFSRYYYIPELYSLLNIVVTALYSNFIIKKIRARLLRSVVLSNGAQLSMEEAMNLISEVCNNGEFNKAALARFYELG